MKPMYIVTRNHNLYVVAKTKCNHYYIALLLNGKRATSWKYMQKNFIRKNFENYIETCDNLQIFLYKEGVTF